MVPITPSTCHGCDEHDGKYFVHDKFSFTSVSRSRDSVSRYPARSMTRA
jgi:hypothetical protein